MKKILLAILVLSFILPVMADAKKRRSFKDSEWDQGGDTCKSSEKCTFTRKDTFPGGIPVEVQIVALGGQRANVDAVIDRTFQEMKRIASSLDETNPSSDISKVNDSSGRGFVEVSPEMIRLLSAVKKCNLWTDGAFDITTTPDIGKFKHIKVAKNLVFLKKDGMRISVKNIIHGFLADLTAKTIYAANINDFYIQIGPVIRTMGTSVVGNWRADVFDADGGYARHGVSLDISSTSVASVIKDENAPMFDPRWSTPIFSPQLKRVTIIAKDAAIAEAVAHGVYILGPHKGIALVGKLQTVKGIVVDLFGNFWKSVGL